MKLTAQTAVSSRSVEEKQVPSWVNDEAVKVLRELRQAANYATLERVDAVTAGAGAYTRLWTSEALPTDACWHVRAEVAGVTTSGTFQAASYVLHGTFRSASGTVAQVGATSSTHSAESAAAIDARFGVDAANRQVYLEARDDAVTAMSFVAVVRAIEVRR